VECVLKINTKEKFKLVFTSKWWAVAAGDYYALERTAESGNRHVVGHSFRESSLGRPYRVPFLAGMFLP
jgi:hypothetical protein